MPTSNMAKEGKALEQPRAPENNESESPSKEEFPTSRLSVQDVTYRPWTMFLPFYPLSEWEFLLPFFSWLHHCKLGI